MSCSVFVHIKYDKELEDKLKQIKGIILKGTNGDIESLFVPTELFPQHKKDVDVHKWIKGKDGVLRHFPQNSGDWEYVPHGFDIWIGFKDDGDKDIVFIIPCHWSPDHGHWTLLDIAQWIKDNLGEIEIKKKNVSY